VVEASDLTAAPPAVIPAFANGRTGSWVGERPLYRGHERAGDSRADQMTGWARTWAIDLAVAGVVGLFLGLVGPFGTYFNGPPWQRVAYWLVSVWAGALV